MDWKLNVFMCSAYWGAVKSFTAANRLSQRTCMVQLFCVYHFEGCNKEPTLRNCHHPWDLFTLASPKNAGFFSRAQCKVHSCRVIINSHFRRHVWLLKYHDCRICRHSGLQDGLTEPESPLLSDWYNADSSEDVTLLPNHPAHVVLPRHVSDCFVSTAD